MGFPLDQAIGKIRQNPSFRVFRYPDFRLLWTGAFLSFSGSFVQTVGQGWLVYQLTNDVRALALVSFCNTVPVTVLGPFAGSMTDTMNRRLVLIAAQLIYAFSALFLAWEVYTGRVVYSHILIIAIINGITSTVEMPTRQSLVSSVVPLEEISAAVPVNAMTFNLARILGPAIGGVMLARLGAASCYLVNGLSFLALIFAVAAIRADISAVQSRKPQPMGDLLFEGMLYTIRDVRLRTLFLMEATVSVWGLFYLQFMPVIVKKMLIPLGSEGLSPQAMEILQKKLLGFSLSAVGVGAVAGLATLMMISHLPIKTLIVRTSMSFMGAALVTLSFVRTPWAAFVVLVVAGAASVMQFNTTNALFQLFSPPHLRGRVLAMHIWALSGFSPIALPLFGWMGEHFGMPITLLIGGAAVVTGAIFGWINSDKLAGAQ